MSHDDNFCCIYLIAAFITAFIPLVVLLFLLEMRGWI